MPKHSLVTWKTEDEKWMKNGNVSKTDMMSIFEKWMFFSHFSPHFWLHFSSHFSEKWNQKWDQKCELWTPLIYLSQFLTVFDEPKIKLKVINAITRLCNAGDRLTVCSQFQPVFEWFWMIFEMRQLATRITPNLGNCNQKIDQTTDQFSPVLWIFLVHRTEPVNST